MKLLLLIPALALALPLHAQPLITGLQVAFDDFSQQQIVTFQITNLVDSHTYIVEKSPDMLTWTRIDQFTWGGPETCCWPVDYPTAPIFRAQFFRVLDATPPLRPVPPVRPVRPIPNA